ncbi:MAG TPA: NUDIX domain-containing protein [Ktedonobacteraceae bacterium]|nr:NUDIX domain-containing protein [Ktedonobacteraceae bacterium]
MEEQSIPETSAETTSSSPQQQDQQAKEQKPPEVKVGVSVLVRKGREVLLEKRAHVHGAGTWGPPSGHIDYGEAPEQTARRETLEETGVIINNLSFMGVTNDLFADEQKHYITLWFDATYLSGELQVKAPEEEAQVGWFDWHNLPTPLFLPLQHLVENNIYSSAGR